MRQTTSWIMVTNMQANPGPPPLHSGYAIAAAVGLHQYAITPVIDYLARSEQGADRAEALKLLGLATCKFV